jgi:hypothetical protein
MPRPRPDDDWEDEHEERERTRPRRRGTRAPREKSNPWLIPLIILGATSPFVFLCCAGAVVGLLYSSAKRSYDPAVIRKALDDMTDVTLPGGLKPEEKRTEVTGVISVSFESGSGQSYLRFTSGERFTLRRSRTVRESSDDGARTAGRQPEKPSVERRINVTVRGRPAEFIYRRFANNETVSGYFQGKQYPVHFEGQFRLGEFPADTADSMVRTIR